MTTTPYREKKTTIHRTLGEKAGLVVEYFESELTMKKFRERFHCDMHLLLKDPSVLYEAGRIISNLHPSLKDDDPLYKVAERLKPDIDNRDKSVENMLKLIGEKTEQNKRNNWNKYKREMQRYWIH